MLCCRKAVGSFFRRYNQYYTESQGLPHSVETTFETDTLVEPRYFCPLLF